MKTKNILIAFLVLAFVLMPTALADDEGSVRVVDSDGNDVTDENHRNVDDGDNNNPASENNEDENNKEDDDFEDVWGIQNSDSNYADYADMNILGGIYSGITPLKNMSLLSIATAAGLALTFVIVGIFILLMVGGFGAAHPNIDKGWKYIRSAQGKLIAVGGIFILALFMITLIFFSLYVFGKIQLQMA